MNNNTFFKPTPLYKEFMILDLIEKNKNITQREIADQIGVAVSMVNNYLDVYEQKGYIKRKYLSTKTVEYFVTKKGLERRKVLNIGYLKASQNLYNSAKENIEQFLRQVEKKGFKNILLYGAGEVAELILQVLLEEEKLCIDVLAVIDDDSNKQGNYIMNIPIISFYNIVDNKFDGILISSDEHNSKIKYKLINSGMDVKKIINYFE